MRILDRLPYDETRLDNIQTKDLTGNEGPEFPRALLPAVKEAWIAAPNEVDVMIKVKVLLDTGNDLTIVNPQIVRELERSLETSGSFIPMCRKVKYYDNGLFEDAFELTLTLPGGYQYSSQIGFVAANRPYEQWDVWLGQDFFERFVVTFDGPAQTITVDEPKS